MELVLSEGGTFLDPVRALARMVAADPVAEEDKPTTPLFRWPSGRAFDVDEVRDVVRVVVRATGADPSRYGAHSLRIGGATAALAGGVEPAVIRLMGRWSSDVYQLYCRLTRQAAARMGLQVGSTDFEDMESARFASEELELVPTGGLYGGASGDFDEDSASD